MLTVALYQLLAQRYTSGKCFLHSLPTALLHLAGSDWQTKFKEGSDASEAVLSFLTTKQMSAVV